VVRLVVTGDSLTGRSKRSLEDRKGHYVVSWSRYLD